MASLVRTKPLINKYRAVPKLIRRVLDGSSPALFAEPNALQIRKTSILRISSATRILFNTESEITAIVRPKDGTWRERLDIKAGQDLDQFNLESALDQFLKLESDKLDMQREVQSEHAQGCGGNNRPALSISRPSWQGVHGRIKPLGLASSSKPRRPFRGRDFATSCPVRAGYRGSKVSAASENPFLYIKDETHPAKPVLSIRQRLRAWESENKSDLFTTVTSLESDFASDKGVTNAITRPSDSELFRIAEDQESSDFYNSGELVDFGEARTFLSRGDLVELRSAGGGQAELAVFIRELESQSQFYTMSGRWLHQRAVVAKFSVSNFVERDAIDAIIPFLPSADVPEAQQDLLQSFKNALPRHIGAPLVLKMQKFWSDADAVYRATSFNLDKAHSIVAKPHTLRYATLQELADELIPSNIARNKSGGFESSVLYAVHRSIMQDDIGFRSQTVGNHRAWGEFEISSKSEYQSIETVCQDVRDYQESTITSSRAQSRASSLTTLKDKSLFNFITKCRQLIDRSREIREPTSDAMLGPAKNNPSRAITPGYIDLSFDKKDRIYINYIESWVALRTFDGRSRMHGIGSTILRAMKRYTNLDLDQATGWTFLQEIGAILPWENRVSFDLRLPRTRSLLKVEGSVPNLVSKTPNLETFMMPDPLKNLRKSWGDTAVYCVDDVSAREIDDGISIADAELPGEYWVSIHVADPASRFVHDSKIGNAARMMTQSIYFPERVVGMLPESIVQEHLSLAPGRNCLTFSARMNLEGEMLEHEITPGTIYNVLYVTPSIVDGVVGYNQNLSPRETNITVGDMASDTQEPYVARKLLAAEMLSEVDKENLKKIFAVGSARRRKMSSRGGFFMQRAQPSISLSLPKELKEPRESSDNSLLYYSDPGIHLKVPIPDQNFESRALTGGPVENMMLLASEIAARWCHERNIPIPFRVTQKNEDKADPHEFYRRVVKPSLLPNGMPPAHISNQYMRLMGTVLPSSVAGPHIALGVDMCAKVTSPLRRYGDLFAHWQIEAALLEEHRLGHSLVGSMESSYLPFSAADVDKVIPRLDSRERAIRSSQGLAVRTWTIQLLLRAWKFGQAILPATWHFSVRSITKDRVSGSIQALGEFNAVMHIPTWAKDQEINVGDEFEVEFEDINAYTRRVSVKGLRRFPTATPGL